MYINNSNLWFMVLRLKKHSIFIEKEKKIKK